MRFFAAGTIPKPNPKSFLTFPAVSERRDSERSGGVREAQSDSKLKHDQRACGAVESYKNETTRLPATHPHALRACSSFESRRTPFRRRQPSACS